MWLSARREIRCDARNEPSAAIPRRLGFALATTLRESAAPGEPEVALQIHMDGQGSAAQKHATWGAVKSARPAGVPLGWKNFYDEDTPTFTPEATMAKRPRPRMISYQ